MPQHRHTVQRVTLTDIQHSPTDMHHHHSTITTLRAMAAVAIMEEDTTSGGGMITMHNQDIIHLRKGTTTMLVAVTIITVAMGVGGDGAEAIMENMTVSPTKPLLMADTPNRLHISHHLLPSHHRQTNANYLWATFQWG